MKIDRRRFLVNTAAFSTLSASVSGAVKKKHPVVDTHMHVWANDTKRYPFPHPYSKDFKDAPHEATVEMLIEDMDRNQCDYSVLVQVIYHGWDNTYVADCVQRFPKRLKAHGLIDPTDPKVADTLEYWVKEHGLHGMRFSAIYYQNGQHGGDGWIHDEKTHRLWRTAEKLGAVFNFFIGTKQLPKLEKMVKSHPNVPIVIDHMSQMDLGADDPEPEFKLLLSMSRYRNVWVKVSELTSVSKSGKYPFTDAYPHVKRLYEAFGGDRLLFGTGYPGGARKDYGRPTLANEMDLIRTKIPFFTDEDRWKILGGNAVKLWGFE